MRMKKDSSDSDDANAKEILSGLEKSLVNAMYQKCNHCRHFGASMKCKSSGKFYHFPCGAASGSYMQKSPQLFIGHDSLKQVGNLGKRDNIFTLQMYLIKMIRFPLQLILPKSTCSTAASGSTAK